MNNHKTKTIAKRGKAIFSRNNGANVYNVSTIIKPYYCTTKRVKPFSQETTMVMYIMNQQS